MTRDSVFDITLNGTGFMLYHELNEAVELPGQFVSAQPNGPLPGAEAVRLFENFSLGMGFGRRLVDGAYSYGENVDTRWPDMVFAGPEVVEVPLPALDHSIDVSFEIDWRAGHYDLFLCAGRYGLMVPDANEPPVGAVDFGSGFVATSAIRFAGGPAYVGGAGGRIWELASGWNQSADVTRRHLAQPYWVTGGQIASGAMAGQGGVGDYRLVGTDGTLNGFRYMSALHLGPSPLIDANWGPADPVQVGFNHWQVVRLVAVNRVVWFVTSGGVYSVDGNGYSANLTPYWEQTVDLTWNGRAAVYYNSALRVAHADYLDRVRVDGRVNDGPDPCGPGEGKHPNESPIWGHISALAIVGSELWCSKYNPELNKSYICTGRPRNEGEDGYGDLVWNGALIVLDGQVTYMGTHTNHASSDGESRVWIATDDDGEYHLFYVRQPQGGHPLQDPNYRFTRSWALYTGLDDGGQQNSWTKKVVRRIDQYADNIEASGGTITVSTSMDGAAYVTQGVLGGAARVSYLTSQTEGTMIGLKIEGTGAETVTPIMRSTGGHVVMLPEQIRRETFKIIIGKDVDRMPLRTLTGQLESLQTMGDIEMTLFGIDYSVKVLPGISYQKVPSPDDDDMIYIANVPIDLITRHWRYDDGTHYDSGEVWW